ncbi:MAG: TIGR01212 family radical SAM protein [Lachnospiraceae bacterium]|nr:TIGR01212 family radical SAM protein [Lachnospiraceae bacterium]
MIRLSDFLKERFGEKIYRLSLSSGCTCPNRDGTVGYGGCSFCSEGGSGEFAADPAPIDVQIEDAKKRILKKTDAEKYIAYFQAYTNTYGDIEHLKALYTETLRRDDIAALSLGTRPDCLGDEVMEMLMELRSIKPVWIELGLQTIHEKTAERIRRGYALPVFERAYERLKSAGLEVIVHVIFNLPGETREDMLETVRYLSRLEPGLDGVKLQMLQILEGTDMAEEYRRNPFPLMSLEEYSDLIAESVSILPDRTVIHRMTGDGPRRLLIAPLWSLDKKRVLNTINRKIKEYC